MDVGLTGFCLSSSVHLKEGPGGCQRGEPHRRKGPSPDSRSKTSAGTLVTAQETSPPLSLEGGAAVPSGATCDVLKASPEFPHQQTLDDAIGKS